MERYDISDHDCPCSKGPEPLCYKDSRGRLYHIFPLPITPLLQGQSWSLISYLSIAQNPSATGTVVFAYIISFHCPEPLCYRDSRGSLYHIFPLHRTPLLQGQSERYAISDHDCPCSRGVLGNGKTCYKRPRLSL
jgi:hypothetical protein